LINLGAVLLNPVEDALVNMNIDHRFHVDWIEIFPPDSDCHIEISWINLILRCVLQQVPLVALLQQGALSVNSCPYLKEQKGENKDSSRDAHEPAEASAICRVVFVGETNRMAIVVAPFYEL